MKYLCVSRKREESTEVVCDLFPARKMTKCTATMRCLSEIDFTQRGDSIEINMFPVHKYSRILLKIQANKQHFCDSVWLTYIRD